MKKLQLLLVVLLVALPPVAAADICDDINDLSNAWNDVADAVHVMGEEGYTRREAREADQLIGEMFDGTEEFAIILVEEGNRTEERLGNRLLGNLDDLEAADTIDDIVDFMDDIVDTLDTIVDYCDTQ